MAGKDKDAKKKADGPAERYDDELLSANWNPVIELLDWSCARTLGQTAREPELREEDVDAFLGRIRTSGS
jgi:hypothetical protein